MTASINTTMNSRQWLMLIALSLLWGGSFFCVGIAVEHLPPLTIVAIRVGLAAVALWVFVFVMGLRPPKQATVWWAFLGMGLLNNVIPFSLIVWGQTHIASGLASILNATTPLFTVLVASLLLTDERATALKLLGVVLGFMGVVVMIGVPAGQSDGNLLAEFAILGAAISYSFAGIFGRRFKAMGINPIVIAAGQVTASFTVMMPISFLVDGSADFSAVPLNVWAALVVLAVLSTALAYVMFFKLLASAGATNVLLVTLLVPVSAILLGILFLGEVLVWTQGVGMLLIVFGLSAIDGRLWRTFKTAKKVSASR